MATEDQSNPASLSSLTPQPGASNLRTLLIERAGHQWIVHWSPGDERLVMEWAIELADQDLSGFTAADARIVAEAVSESLHRYKRPRHAPPGSGPA